jgi:hypothetical protein
MQIQSQVLERSLSVVANLPTLLALAADISATITGYLDVILSDESSEVIIDVLPRILVTIQTVSSASQYFNREEPLFRRYPFPVLCPNVFENQSMSVLFFMILKFQLLYY